MSLRLTLGMSTNPRTRPVFQGRAKADGVDLQCTNVHVAELFWRQLKNAEFDISEMSMSSLLMSIANGDTRFVGLPIFTTRRMFHTNIWVRKDRGIDKPADLNGKKVGVPEYQQTSALWTRGVLQHDFGVSDKDMEHWMDRQPGRSHADETGFPAPKGVTIHRVGAETNIGQMLLDGKLDAVMSYNIQRDNTMDRSTADLSKHPDIKSLFDRDAEAARFYKTHQMYPINHGMVIKRELHEKHPWIALNIFKAFETANTLAEAERMQHVEYHLETGLLPPEARKAIRTPLLQHGIRANRKSLETLAQYSYEQGLTPRVMKLEELFAASTLEQ